ncbi:MAG: tetratricopeptide repeat protein [Treponema sp.]|nr:tetratricopeptide repeat protein [Treponema sp.]
MNRHSCRRRLSLKASGVIFALCIAFSSCTSQYGLNVPGQSRIIIKNLSIEYYNVAEAYAENKNYAKAAEYYKLAMRDKALYLQAYYKMGRSYALAKDWDKAYDVYADLLQRDKDNTDLKLSLIYIKAMKGDVDEALRDYQALFERFPNNQTVLENYISLLVETGKGELAEKQLAVLKTTFPDSKLISTLAPKIAELVDNMDTASFKEQEPEENASSDKKPL